MLKTNHQLFLLIAAALYVTQKHLACFLRKAIINHSVFPQIKFLVPVQSPGTEVPVINYEPYKNHHDVSP